MKNEDLLCQAPSDAVPLMFGLHCSCVLSYLYKPLKCITPVKKIT